MDADAALRYDKMINWDTRLQREIPVMAKYMRKGTLLDVACSSGRHSFALEKHGIKGIGIDISESFIELANTLKQEYNSECKFLCADATGDLKDQIAVAGFHTFDNAILLGNAIANFGSLEAGKQVISNIYDLLEEGGIFFTQTVNRVLKPHYLPLRAIGDKIIQRIMVPVHDTNLDYNAELHVNTIVSGEYENNSINSRFFLYSVSEFEELLSSIGFKLLHKFGGYNDEPVSLNGGDTTVWIFQK